MQHFGTDGIRAKAEVFTQEYLKKIVRAALAVNRNAKFLIGRDTRESGLEIEKHLSQTISEYGNKAIIAGMTPTPTLAFLTQKLEADYGIMISASHNPPEYNGIKFFSCYGEKISDDIEKQIDKLIDNPQDIEPSQTPVNIEYYYGDNDYIDYIVKRLKPQIKGMKICLDCANGATALIAPMLFAKLGAEVTAHNINTGGKDINKGCGATEPLNLLEKMKAKDYDIGFSYDGDGDRLMCIQNNKIFNGDHLMYCHAKVMKQKGVLKNNTIVGTIMSNMGAQKAIEKAGLKLIRTAVGDKHVHREMKKNGYNIGGEESGHIIFTDYMNTGDGILASILTAMLAKEYSLSELDDIVEYPNAVDCYICDKNAVGKYQEDKEIKRYIENLDFEGRVVVRPSGTEPKIRILVEATEQDKADYKAREIKDFLQWRLD